MKKKLFNYSELHFSEVSCYKMHTLDSNTPQKKVPLGIRGFHSFFFLLLATPYVMFEIKKTTQILTEFLEVQLAGKKSFLVGKKSSPRV